MKVLDEADLRDIILGATLFGTGGGGDPKVGWHIVKKTLRRGGEFRLAELGEIKKGAIVAMPYSVGSLSSKKVASFYPKGVVTRSFELLEEYLGESFAGVIATELGGANTARALVVGALLGKVVVDADAAGRAVPELQHSTYHLLGMPMTPFSLVTPHGDELIFSRVKDDTEAEKIVRAIVSAIGANVGVTSHSFRVSEMGNAVVHGTVSRSLRTGRELRIAREDGKNPEEVLEGLGWTVLFRGIVVGVERREKGGFTVGEFELEGVEGFKNESYRIVFKNENLASWRNGRIDVTVPDLISMVTPEGVPVINSEVKEGSEYIVVGHSAPEIWRTPKGLEIFGPKYLGLDSEYVPIEAKRGVKLQYASAKVYTRDSF